MSDASDGAWRANLLAALALHVTTRTRAAAATQTERPEADTIALIALTVVAPGTSQDMLALMLGQTQSGITRLVDRLERAGLVRRDRGPDLRTHAVHTTERGAELAARALRGRQDATTQVMDALNEDEQHVLSGLLEKLLAGAVGDRRDPWRICRSCDARVCHDVDRCPVTQAAGH